MKNILIALDYDPTAQKVAETGYALGKAMGAEVTLLHVVAEPVYYASTEYSPIMGFSDYLGTGPIQLDNIEGLKKASQHFLEKTKHHLGDHAILTIVAEGEYAESIMKAAKHCKADIIVMGSHSRKWLQEIMMGSITEEVLRQSSIPVLVIPTKGKKQ